MGNINTKFHPSKGVSVDFSSSSDVDVRFAPSADIAISFESDYTSYERVYNAFGSKPSSQVSGYYQTMMEALDAAGSLAKCDIFQFFSAHNQADSLINWKNPGLYNPTAIDSPTWTQYEGFTSTGPTIKGYVDCNYNPNTNGDRYKLNDATVIVGTGNEVVDASECGADIGSDETRINGWSNGTQIRASLNSSSYAWPSNTLGTGVGHFGVSRSNSTQIKVWQNSTGALYSVDSTAIPNGNIWATTANLNGPVEVTEKQVRYVWVGGALTDQEYEDTIDAIEACLDSLGTGLISEYSAEYQTVYDSYTTKPDAATAAIWNTFVESMVATGEWTELDILYVYAAHTNGAGEALKNWKLPGTFDATAYNSPAFTANEGFTGDGSTAYIDCNWNPSANGVNYLQDDASMGCYVRTNTAAGNKVDIGVWDNSNRSTRILSRSASDLARVRVNATADGTGSNTDARGMWIANRVLSTHQDLYKNKVRLINHARASSTPPDISVYSLAMNYQGSINAPTDRQISMAFAGGGLTQGQIDNITDYFETAMDALGKGVIDP